MLFSATACGGDNGDNNNQNNNTQTVELPDSSDYFIQNGASAYKVVTADVPRDYESHAANELVANTLQATGVTLPIVKESEVAVTADSKLLIIGETSLATAAGITVSKNEFGARGFKIKKIDTNVYFLGGDTSGTLYAVYEFLHHQFGYEPYAMDEIYLEKGVTDDLLKAYDVVDIPDIPYVQGIGPYYREKNLYAGHRMRYNIYDEVFVDATGQPWHNTLVYIDPDKYEAEHPKWFTGNADSGSRQLHYTAYGDEEELAALQDEVFNQLVAAIEREFSKGKFYEYIGFMHEDNQGAWAASDEPYLADNTANRGKDLSATEMAANDSVQILKNKYGNGYKAAMLIEFINPIAKRMKAYMDEKWDGREMNITIFGYLDTEAAPVKNENGKQVPVDPVNGVLEDNVCVMLAPIRADYSTDYSENITLKSLFESWSVVSSKVTLWLYDYYFSHPTSQIMYLDSTYSLKSFYQAAKEINVQYLFNESGADNVKGIAFQTLKLYLTSKLTWDTELDDRELIDNFFINYFKQASTTMRKYFEELRTYLAIQKSTQKYPGIGSSDPTEKKYWNEGVLVQFLGYIEQAYKDIEPLKATDVVTYQKLCDRIAGESLMIRCLALRHYSKEIYKTEANFFAEVALFKEDCKRLEMEYIGNYGDSVADMQFIFG